MAIDSDTFRRLRLARLRLREESESARTVKQLAEELRLSQFHFIRRFDALFGATPNQFRTHARIERAKELLARGETSVTEACMAVGFTSVGSFSALFKARVGLSPSAYRAQMAVLAQAAGVARGELPPELTPGCLSLLARLPADAFRNSREAAATPSGDAPRRRTCVEAERAPSNPTSCESS